MRARAALVLLIVLIPAFTVPAQGQLFRKPTPTPTPTRTDLSSKVPELLTIIKSDPDERKRGSAVDLLQRVDAGKHPEIIPVLIDALLKDPKPNVRMEAVQTLARVRPPSAEIGLALEQAMEKDPSRMIKTYARSAYMPHRTVTIQAKKAEEAKPPTTTAGPRMSPAKPGERPGTSSLKPPTPAVPSIPQPLPASSTFTTASPVPPAQATPTKMTPIEGPVLAPPK